MLCIRCEKMTKRRGNFRTEENVKKKRKKVENIVVDKSTDLLLRAEILEMCHSRGTEKSC